MTATCLLFNTPQITQKSQLGDDRGGRWPLWQRGCHYLQKKSGILVPDKLMMGGEEPFSTYNKCVGSIKHKSDFSNLQFRPVLRDFLGRDGLGA
jgi:hypothetical protein